MKNKKENRTPPVILYAIAALMVIAIGIAALLRGLNLDNSVPGTGAPEQERKEAISEPETSEADESSGENGGGVVRALTDEEKKAIRQEENKQTKVTTRKSGGITYLSDFIGVEQLPDGMSVLITDFLDVFYGSQMKISSVFKSLDGVSAPDMTGYFVDPKGLEAAVWQNALHYLLAAKTVNFNDLSYNSCDYSLSVSSVSTDGDVYTVALKETYQVSFAYLKGIKSGTYGQESVITFRSVNGEWKIETLYREEDFYLAIRNYLEEGMTAEDIPVLCQNALSRYCKNFLTIQNDKREFNSGAVVYDAKWQNDYNREAAGDYAASYATARNPDFTDYSTMGGNDQNYVSQCLLAGGIPMDAKGWYVWKYYGDNVDESTNATGRTPSWTGAAKFYIYAECNSGFGMVSTVNANLFSAECGDVLQVGGKEETIGHSNIVIDTYTEDGEVVEILLNSNSQNRTNWPLNALFSAEIGLIKIHGWNS